jgi:transposase
MDGVSVVSAPAPECLQQVRLSVRSMLEDGRGEAAIDLLLDLIAKLQTENSALGLRLQQLMKKHYGRKSEGVSSGQLALLLGALLQTPAKAEAPTESSGPTPTPVPAPPPKKERKRAPHGRREFPADLERQRRELRVPDAARTCPLCGKERICIGHEVSSMLEFFPARFVVIENAREKLACPPPCDGKIVIAESADKVVEGGMAGAGLLADVVVSKFKDHLPLYRIMQRYGRLGVKLATSTLSDWVGDVAVALDPIVGLIRTRMLASFLVQTDSTGLKVLDRREAGKIKRGSMWCYVGDGLYVYFDYSPDGTKEWTHDLLRDREGFLQADASSVYDGLFTAGGTRLIEVGCWMHGRRYFVAALEAGDLRAAVALDKIKTIYRVEEEARRARAGPEELRRRRQEQAKPVLVELEQWMTTTAGQSPPKSPMAKAIGYCMRQWRALCRYLEDGRLPIDNGEPERRQRGIAVGRKNYLFAGSDEGARRAARIYTVIASCEAAGVEPSAYLRDILEKLSGTGWPQHRLPELLPSEWAKRHVAAATRLTPSS